MTEPERRDPLDAAGAEEHRLQRAALLLILLFLALIVAMWGYLYVLLPGQG